MGGIPEFHRNILSCASSIIKPRMSPQCPKRFLYPKHCRPHGNSECLPLEPVWYQNWIEEKRRKSRGLWMEGLGEGLTLRSARNGVWGRGLEREEGPNQLAAALARAVPGTLGCGVSCARALQQQVDYFKGENHVLKDQLADHKPYLTDADRRRLAVLGHRLGRKLKARAVPAPAPSPSFPWPPMKRKMSYSRQRWSVQLLLSPGRPNRRADFPDRTGEAI